MSKTIGNLMNKIMRRTASANETVSLYFMNPAEDEIIYSDELKEGMLVLSEKPQFRRPYGDSEKNKIRAQQFRRVTRLRHEPGLVTFIGEWIDGYQETHRCSAAYGWIVKRGQSRGLSTEIREEK